MTEINKSIKEKSIQFNESARSSAPDKDYCINSLIKDKNNGSKKAMSGLVDKDCSINSLINDNSMKRARFGTPNKDCYINSIKENKIIGKKAMSGLPNRPNSPYFINHKGQEEIMGFMLIVILVMVGLLAFLIFFQPKPVERNDLGLENLVYSWLSTSLESGNVKSAIKDCESGDCAGLTGSVDILQKGIDLVPAVNGWSLNITNSGQLLDYKQGNRTGNSRAAVIPISDSLVKLKVWYD